MKKFFKFLNGKKSVIAGIATLLIGYLQNRSVIDEETSLLCLNITTVLLGWGIGHKISKKYNKEKKNGKK